MLDDTVYISCLITHMNKSSKPHETMCELWAWLLVIPFTETSSARIIGMLLLLRAYEGAEAIGGKRLNRRRNTLNDWGTNILWNHVLTPFTYFLLLAESIASELAARWPVCIYSWLTVTGSGGFALHYRLLIMLFWAAVRRFSLSPDIRRLAEWQRDD